MTVRKELLNNIRIVDPYVPGEQPRQKVVKLNTNENPYPPAPEVKAVFDELKEDEFRLYPDPTSGKLIKALADQLKVGEDQIFVGVDQTMCFRFASLRFLIRKNRYYFLILHILFIRYGQICTGFRMSARN